MKTIELKADYGYFDAVTNSRINLYHVGYFIHGSPLGTPPDPGYFLFHTTRTIKQFPQFVITLEPDITTPFNVSLSIDLRSLFPGEEMAFHVVLEPGNATPIKLKPYVKNSTDHTLDITVLTPTLTGVYVIEIFCTSPQKRNLIAHDCTVTM
jgi:hypothetical protein